MKEEMQIDGEPVPCQFWGREGLDEATITQMERARRLPVSVRAAQMPDGHVGYGLPIGGVLATRNAVIPYAVGVDIGCRMKLSIIDVPGDRIAGLRDKLKVALRDETRFGMGKEFDSHGRRDHDVMASERWQDLPPRLKALKEKAWGQLGTSGSGNHFVEWGELDLPEDDLGLPAGRYIALLSHSGSRGFGAQIADFYTRLAMEKVPLPKEYKHLAWLDMRGNAGQEYWNAMELAGEYSSANHDLIHRYVLKAAGFKPAVQVENHHNFAWKEEHHGEEVIVHRKGATPAGEGVLGVIPGSMGDPGYVVRGKGSRASLHSAAHGAGRAHSRTQAKQLFTKRMVADYLKERGVELMAAGVDEAPMAYKRIETVMSAQADLVQPIAAFHPRLVLMADDGTAED